jgi:hypothetical protein
MGTHPSKVQGKWEHKKTQPKEKIKVNNQQKSSKNRMQRRPMAMKWQTTITKKTYDERTIIYHKSASDKGVVAMMCDRDEEPWQVQQLAKESLWLVHVIGLWTCNVDSKKQASKGLKKTIDDV